MLVDRDVEKGKLEKSFLSFYFLSRATVSIEFHRHHYKASELKTRAFVLISLFHTTYPTTTTSIVSYHRSPAVWARERRNTIVARRNKNNNSIITPTHGTRSKSKKRSIDKIRLVP